MKQNKKIIGLTGTMASGKSTAAAYFRDTAGIPVIDADKIVVLDQGHVAEQGTHAELLKAKGCYYRLYTRQYEEEATHSALA